MKRIQVAIIGCGTIAKGSHIPHYIANEASEIKYFCDVIPERANAMVEKHGCGKAVYDYREILNDPELEAVSVCTHNDSHAQISIDFMRAGKDVLCEKPAARVLAEALEMQRVAHETGRTLNIGACNRFGTAVNQIKSLLMTVSSARYTMCTPAFALIAVSPVSAGTLPARIFRAAAR